MNENWNEKLKESFDQIHAEPELKQHTMDYLNQKVYQRHRQVSPAFRRFAAAAACFVCLFLAGGSWMFFTPSAYISIDVNPSLELGINRFDRIISAKAYNDDGQDLLSTLDVKYENYKDALDEIMADQDIVSYMENDGLLTLTVACDDEEKNTEIMDTVKECTSGHSNVHCHSGDTEEIHEAHEEGLSFGKYQAYLRLHELNPSITIDDIRDLPMREIWDMISSYSDGTDTSGNKYGNNETEDESQHDSDEWESTEQSFHEGEHNNSSNSENKGHGNQNHENGKYRDSHE